MVKFNDAIFIDSIILFQGDSDKIPCSPACAASQLKKLSPESLPEPSPPPLLPRPPNSKSRSSILSSSTSSDLSETYPRLLIELDRDISSNRHLNDDLFTIPVGMSTNNINESSSTPKYLKPTNPFYQSPPSVPFQNDLCSIYKSSSGPNVRNMINMWQSPPPVSENHSLSSSADKLKSVSSVSTHKSQLLSRTVSTPPALSSVYSDHPSMMRLKSASKVSTNPFLVADHQNNNNNSRENADKENANSSTSSWESFH